MMQPMMNPMVAMMQMQQMVQMQQMQQMMNPIAQMQQMQQMAQMQQMSQMQLPMMQMQLPATPAVPAAPAGPSPEDIRRAEEDAELARCSLEDLSALELEVKELEKKAKSTAKLKDGFVGLMARYIEDEGFGFITCTECKDRWDKTDIFCSGRTFMASEIEVGDFVAFTVEKDGKNMPRAVTPKTLEDLTRLSKRLKRMREVLRSIGVAPAAHTTSAGGAPPSLKRPPSNALLEAHMMQGPAGVKRPNLGVGPWAHNT